MHARKCTPLASRICDFVRACRACVPHGSLATRDDRAPHTHNTIYTCTFDERSRTRSRNTRSPAQALNVRLARASHNILIPYTHTCICALGYVAHVVRCARECASSAFCFGIFGRGCRGNYTHTCVYTVHTTHDRIPHHHTTTIDSQPPRHFCYTHTHTHAHIRIYHSYIM